MNCQCGCGHDGHDWHHALIGRKKGLKILDDPRNLVFVNHDEHIARTFDTPKWRRFFWELHCKIYGEASMLEWVEEVKRTTKLHKSRFDFMKG